MSLNQSTVALFYLISLVESVSSFTFDSLTEVTEVPEVPEVIQNMNLYNILMSAFRQRVIMEDIDEEQKTRVNRDSQDKFTQAANLNPLRLLHLVVITFKHLFMKDPSKGEINIAESGKRLGKMFKGYMLEFNGLESERMKPNEGSIQDSPIQDSSTEGSPIEDEER